MWGKRECWQGVRKIGILTLAQKLILKEYKMSKAHRGTGIRELPNQGKATCPVCKRESVKCLYEVEIEGAKANVCKQCNAKLKK